MIKPVRLTDQCVFNCELNPITGKIDINISGQVSNIKNYNLSRDIKKVAMFSSALAMMSLMAGKTFKEYSNFIMNNPKIFIQD